jgi:aspartate/methionine/tyrosine aminotransferase
MGLLPVEAMQEILSKAGSATNQERLAKSLNYVKSDRGDPELLAEIAAFMDRHTPTDDMGTPPTEADIEPVESPTTDMFVTHGVSHGLDIICTAQTQPGDVVLIERPTYFLVQDIFTSHGLNVKSLPMKEAGGVNVERLEELLESGEMEPPRMIYVIPTHQNPTGRTMSIEDRWKLAVIASRYGILVAADEVYHLLDWRDEARDGRRPARFAALDSKIASKSGTSHLGCCVTVSSFTKTFTPGVRCGWIEGPKEIIDSLVDLGYIQSQVCLSREWLCLLAFLSHLNPFSSLAGRMRPFHGRIASNSTCRRHWRSCSEQTQHSLQGTMPPTVSDPPNGTRYSNRLNSAGRVLFVGLFLGCRRHNNIRGVLRESGCQIPTWQAM